MTQLLPIDDFLPHALPYCPSVPEPTVLKQLRDICRDYCETTKLWRDTDSFTVAAPDFEGLLTVNDADIVSIEDCRLDGRKLEPKTVAELDQIRDGWLFDTDEGTATYLTQLQPNSLTIYPRQTGTLQLRLVLQPSLEAQTVPFWLITKFGSQIGKGAAARCLLIPKTEFYNPDLAAPLIREFDAWRDLWSTKSRKGQQGGRIRTKGRYF